MGKDHGERNYRMMQPTTIRLDIVRATGLDLSLGNMFPGVLLERDPNGEPLLRVSMKQDGTLGLSIGIAGSDKLKSMHIYFNYRKRITNIIGYSNGINDSQNGEIVFSLTRSLSNGITHQGDLRTLGRFEFQGLPQRLVALQAVVENAAEHTWELRPNFQTARQALARSRQR